MVSPPYFLVLPTLILLLTACSTNSSIDSSTDSKIDSKIEPPSVEEPISQTIDSSERLIATPPPSWKLVYQINTTTTRLSDFVPPDQTEKEWTSKLSFESFTELIDSDPIALLLAEVTRDEGNCVFVQHFNLYSGLENGYPTSVRLFLCGENTFSGQGEVKMIKAIQGEDYFYFVKLIKRIAPFKVNRADFQKGEIAAWSGFFQKITLCNNNSSNNGNRAEPEHICPDN